MSTREQDIARIEAALRALSEHFDTVQIFTTRHEPAVEDGTITLNLGAGNWYARYGQVTEWVIKSDERAREAVRAEED